MDKICKNCKSYKPDIDKIHKGFNIHTKEIEQSQWIIPGMTHYKNIEFVKEIKYNYGQCLNEKISYQNTFIDNDEVSYKDAECYSAILIVGEKFGCIHWECK